jgi:hypothetical protein
VTATIPSSRTCDPGAGRGVRTVGVEAARRRRSRAGRTAESVHGATAIRYALPVAASVSLEVFNLKGERVAVLVEEEQGPGEYSVSFGPGARGVRAGLASGIYFCRFRAGSFTATHRMVMMR